MSGWSTIAGSQALVKVIDTLLDLDPHGEFNKSELARSAGVSRTSLYRVWDDIERLGLVEPVDASLPGGQNRYIVGNTSIVRLLKLLDNTVEVQMASGGS